MIKSNIIAGYLHIAGIKKTESLKRVERETHKVFLWKLEVDALL